MIRETLVHRRSLVEWGHQQPESVVLSGDLTAACECDGFQEAFPERFISFGLMEQNMMSFSAGLAREGLIPLVHTFAVFMYRRALDQVEMSIAYGDMPVRMFGFLPGVTTPGGPSHQATNDIAVLRSLPNMTIVEAGDATDVEGLFELSKKVDGPIYFRMLRGEVPRIFPKNSPLELNVARELSSGDEITLLTSGVCTEESLRVTSLLKSKGIGIKHLHVTTLKPFTDPVVIEALECATSGVITMENHTAVGGLGTCVAEVMAENGISKKLVRLSTGDRYLQGANQPYLMENYGVSAASLVSAVEKIVGKSIGITDDQILESIPDNFVSENQVEAL